MKNIIVTGTSRGIGFQLVSILSKMGHNVLALSRNENPVLAADFKNVHCFSFDITKDEMHEKVVKYVTKNWDQVDLLINNAGTLLNKNFMDSSNIDFELVYKVNVFGVAAITRSILPFMNKDSHVLNISSMGGVQGSVKFPGLAIYSSSKGALISLTELLAEEFKENGPSFNVLALGAVQTEMLAEAFPDYKAPVSAREMASYIANFGLNGHKFYNGKIMQVSNSTP